MHLEILVEEPSVEAALLELLPRILEPHTAFRIIVHQGKQNLLRKLPRRLRGYRSWKTDDWRIVVVIDQDREDCHQIKERLRQIAEREGFAVASAAGAQQGEVLFRIAVEELEAWFFGDATAMRAAYPRVSKTLEKQARFRDPDGITGGTSEALEQVLQTAGYHDSGLRKIEAARAIAVHMDPDRNSSRSFQVFRDGLRFFAGT